MRNHRSHYLGGEEKARIEIIPMIDIMMFLLVFFMLATLKMIQGAGIKLDLPQSSTAEQLQQTIKVSIGVTKGDQLYLDAKEITPEALTAHLQELVHESKKVDVAIAGADPAAAPVLGPRLDFRGRRLRQRRARAGRRFHRGRTLVRAGHRNARDRAPELARVCGNLRLFRRPRAIQQCRHRS